MAISVNPSLPVIAAQGVGTATSGVVLQPGTVVSAQVLNVADNLVQIAIANFAFDVLSEVPLIAGQTLQLAVSQTQNGGVRLAIVGQGTIPLSAPSADTVSLAPNAPVNAPASPAAVAIAASDPLTPLERMAVSVASESAATRQQSLAPLFANLAAAAASDSLPPTLHQAVMQVLAQQTSLDPNLGGSDIQAAFQKSGLLLEASLASQPSVAANGVPDLKAALIVLRQALAATVEAQGPVSSPAAAASTQPAAASTQPAAASAQPAAASVQPATAVRPSAVPPTSAPPLSPEIEAPHILLPQAVVLPSQQVIASNSSFVLSEALLNLQSGSATTDEVLNLLQETPDDSPRAAGNATATMRLPDGRHEDVILRTLTPPPPFRGALPAAQPVASSSIPQNPPLATIAHRLLEDTDAAIARQTLLQVASLPDRVDASAPRTDAAVPRWNFEIPFATPQGTAMAQFEISRDGGGTEAESAKRTWRARFSLDIEPAGPVHALVTLSGERTSVRMWAERPQTAARLRAGSAELSQALSRAELLPGDIVIREGVPPQPAPAKAGHFLDRAL